MALPAILVLLNKEAKLSLDKFRQNSEDVRTQQGVETVNKKKGEDFRSQIKMNTLLGDPKMKVAVAQNDSCHPCRQSIWNRVMISTLSISVSAVMLKNVV